MTRGAILPFKGSGIEKGVKMRDRRDSQTAGDTTRTHVNLEVPKAEHSLQFGI